MPKDRSLTVQRTLYVSPEMWEHLQQLAQAQGRGCTENSLMRDAIRAYIDDQAQVIGSRRHFQKSFQQRIDQLETQLTSESTRQTQLVLFYLHVIVQLLAFSLAYLLQHLTKNPITAQQLIQRAVIDARKEEAVLAEQIRVVREMRGPDRS